MWRTPRRCYFKLSATIIKTEYDMYLTNQPSLPCSLARGRGLCYTIKQTNKQAKKKNKRYLHPPTKFRPIFPPSPHEKHHPQKKQKQKQIAINSIPPHPPPLPFPLPPQSTFPHSPPPPPPHPLHSPHHSHSSSQTPPYLDPTPQATDPPPDFSPPPSPPSP